MCKYVNFFVVWAACVGQNGLQRAVRRQQVIAGMVERMKVIAHHQLF